MGNEDSKRWSVDDSVDDSVDVIEIADTDLTPTAAYEAIEKITEVLGEREDAIAFYVQTYRELSFEFPSSGSLVRVLPYSEQPRDRWSVTGIVMGSPDGGGAYDLRRASVYSEGA